mgnify:CR=1 FL=1
MARIKFTRPTSAYGGGAQPLRVRPRKPPKESAGERHRRRIMEELAIAGKVTDLVGGIINHDLFKFVERAASLGTDVDDFGKPVEAPEGATKQGAAPDAMATGAAAAGQQAVAPETAVPGQEVSALESAAKGGTKQDSPPLSEEEEEAILQYGREELAKFEEEEARLVREAAEKTVREKGRELFGLDEPEMPSDAQESLRQKKAAAADVAGMPLPEAPLTEDQEQASKLVTHFSSSRVGSIKAAGDALREEDPSAAVLAAQAALSPEDLRLALVAIAELPQGQQAEARRTLANHIAAASIVSARAMTARGAAGDKEQVLETLDRGKQLYERLGGTDDFAELVSRMGARSWEKLPQKPAADDMPPEDAMGDMPPTEGDKAPAQLRSTFEGDPAVQQWLASQPDGASLLQQWQRFEAGGMPAEATAALAELRAAAQKVLGPEGVPVAAGEKSLTTERLQALVRQAEAQGVPKGAAMAAIRDMLTPGPVVEFEQGVIAPDETPDDLLETEAPEEVPEEAPEEAPRRSIIDTVWSIVPRGQIGDELEATTGKPVGKTPTDGAPSVPEPMPEPIKVKVQDYDREAVEGAAAVNDSLDSLNEKRKAEGKPPVEIEVRENSAGEIRLAGDSAAIQEAAKEVDGLADTLKKAASAVYTRNLMFSEGSSPQKAHKEITGDPSARLTLKDIQNMSLSDMAAYARKIAEISPANDPIRYAKLADKYRYAKSLSRDTIITILTTSEELSPQDQRLLASKYKTSFGLFDPTTKRAEQRDLMQALQFNAKNKPKGGAAEAIFNAMLKARMGAKPVDAEMRQAELEEKRSVAERNRELADKYRAETAKMRAKIEAEAAKNAKNAKGGDDGGVKGLRAIARSLKSLYAKPREDTQDAVKVAIPKYLGQLSGIAVAQITSENVGQIREELETASAAANTAYSNAVGNLRRVKEEGNAVALGEAERKKAEAETAKNRAAKKLDAYNETYRKYLGAKRAEEAVDNSSNQSWASARQSATSIQQSIARMRTKRRGDYDKEMWSKYKEKVQAAVDAYNEGTESFFNNHASIESKFREALKVLAPMDVTNP